MAITRDLFLSILALDSYNRGYNAGISGLREPDASGTVIEIGTARLISAKGDAAAKATGFYATAYNWNGEKVISYRGTDNFGKINDPVSGGNDILNGWVAGLGYSGVRGFQPA